MDTSSLLSGYDPQHLTVGVLGGHSALDVCYGAKRSGFSTVCVARKGRERTYTTFYRTRIAAGGEPLGCVDDAIVVDQFSDILRPEIQEQIRARNTIFVHSRYFWVYFQDFAHIEHEFRVPIYGSRHLLKLEERDQPFNQYHLLQYAGIRTPRIFSSPQEMDGRLCIVKASEAHRGYERAFFLCHDAASWESEGSRLEREGKVSAGWRNAVIEEFIIGAHVNFNFFWSPLTEELELLGTDMRRQTNLDGFLRLPAEQQKEALKHVPLKMIETGHVAVTVKESLLERAFDMGERFVAECRKLDRAVDPAQKGIIGPFALQGAVVAEEGREEIVIFDVSLRIPGSPGTRSTPYSAYLHGASLSVGERIGRELRMAVDAGALGAIVT